LIRNQSAFLENPHLRFRREPTVSNTCIGRMMFSSGLNFFPLPGQQQQLVAESAFVYKKLTNLPFFGHKCC
jgi:hypothetical protein